MSSFNDRTTIVPPTPPGAAGQRIATFGEQPGDMLGPYKLMEILGEGGFGIVWLAERREPFVQRVALKIIRAGMDTESVIARFEQERQALAVMDHPNVAKVHDSGTTSSGRPYFVMEHVAGEPITSYCDRHQLTIRQRLELFIPVCEAVQHAHHKGIIHRDLKPSNILVGVHDEKPVPMVIDFGVAKAMSRSLTDKTIFTESGQLIGTPEYMSPEQAEMRGGDIDTRSDVYSLGVVLYELLSGALPFDPARLRSAAYAEIQRIIREQEPPKPSTRLTSLSNADATTIAKARQTARETLARQLRSELDWIPLKAMRKDRTERYNSPADLAGDIRNYLDGRPLTAGPESAIYRMRKLARRNKGLVAATAAVAAALVLGVVGFAWQAQRVTVQRDRAIKAEQAAESDKRRAVATSNFVLDMLASVDPEKAKGREITVREMLNVASDQVGNALKDDPAAHASLRSTLGQSYYQLSMYREAADQLETAADLDIKALGPDNKETLTVQHNHAAALLSLGRIEDARKLLQHVYEARSRTLGPGSEDALASLSLLGFAAQKAGDDEGSLKVYKDALEAQRKSQGPTARGTLETLASYADVLHQMGRDEEADKAAQELIRDATTAEGADGRMTLMGQSIRAAILKDLGKLDESERLSRESLAIKRRIYGLDHDETLVTENTLAQTLEQQKKYDEAITLLTHAAQASEKSVGEEHSSTLSYLGNLARNQQLVGKLDEAETLMRRVLAIRQKTSGPEAQPTLSVMNNLGLLLLDRKKPAEAEPIFRAMLAGVEKNMPADHWIRGQARMNIGECLFDQGKYAEAEPLMLEGFEKLKQTLPATHDRIAGAKVSLAKLYNAWGKPEKAAEYQK